MTRILLTLRYDGTHYHGWQVQPNGVTVQQTLQDAIERITGVRSGVIGCSRTDAGVHAMMFCCTFDTETPLRGDKLCRALNAVMPFDIAVTDAKEVPADFHPRYDAKGKRYIYRIYNGRVRDPFSLTTAVHVNRPLDDALMDRAAKAFLGTHDFAAFCAAGSSVEDTVRTVTEATVTREGDRVTFTVAADGFLYNMVRIMAGTLLDIADGRIDPDELPAIIASGDRSRAGKTAPAHGLHLAQVFY